VTADIVNLADRRRASGVDWALFDKVADEVAFGDDILADLRPRLALLDAELRSGNPIAERYWRLLCGEFLRAVPVGDRESALDSLTVISALLFHWSGRHANELEEARHGR
jgi:hypothetical protein